MMIFSLRAQQDLDQPPNRDKDNIQSTQNSIVDDSE